MSAIKRNIIANLLAGSWITTLTLAITPLQINILGIEAYGLIGFIATLQIIFAVFDLGLSSTLTREIATDQSEDRVRSVDLIRTASTIYWSFGVVVGVGLGSASNFIASHWFNATELSVGDVEHGLYAITIYLAARWPVAMYVGVLTGLQRMDVLNVVKTSTTSLRLVGGIVVLLIWQDLQIFLWWTASNAFVEVIAYLAACRRTFPLMPWRFGLSLHVLKSIWAFSLSMSALSLIALFISQLDRLIVSKLLLMEDFGHYTLAYNTAAVASLGISAVSSAMVPSFAAAYGQASTNTLSLRYDRANRVILFVVGFVVLPLIFFGDLIISVWISPIAATGAVRPLALIAAGFWCSAVLSNAYSLSVASGNPGLPLRLSAISALPYAAVLYWMTRNCGVDGAALAWLLLNLAYVIVLVPVVHRKILKHSTRGWLVGTVLPFAIAGIGAFALPKHLSAHFFAASGATPALIALAISIGLYVLFGYRLLGPDIRTEIAALLRISGKHSVQSRS